MLVVALAAPHAEASATEEGDDCAPSVALAHARAPSARFDLPVADGRLDASESRLAACLFDTRAAGARLGLGMDYQYTRYEYTGVSGRDRDLHRLAFPLSFATAGVGTVIAGVLAPGVSTSSNVFKDLARRGDSQDFELSGRIEASWPAGHRRRWLVGIAYDRAFGDDRLYPLLAMDYRPAPRLRLRLGFPDSGIEYRHGDRQALTARLSPAGHRWHVTSDELGADFDYEVEALRLGVTWSYRPRAQFTLDLTLGYEFAREHRLTDDTGARFGADAGDELVIGFGFRLGAAPLPAVHGRRLPPTGAD